MNVKTDKLFLAGYRSLITRIAEIRKRYWSLFFAFIGSHLFFISQPYLKPEILLIYVAITWGLMIFMVQQFRTLEGEQEKLRIYNHFLSENDYRLQDIPAKNPELLPGSNWFMWSTQFAPLVSLMLILWLA
jgi:hypothetical protein